LRKFRDFIMGEVRYSSLMKTFPQEAEELFVATERNAKLRYEGYKKLSETNLHRHTKTTKAEASWWSRLSYCS
jgi:hypothetical protein